MQFHVPKLEENEEVFFDVLQLSEDSKLLEGGERFVIRNSKRKIDFPKIDLEKVIDTEPVSVFPNPTKGFISVNYSVIEGNTPVVLELFSLADGKAIQTLFKGNRDKGWHTERFEVHELPAGIYVLKTTLGTTAVSQKIVIE